MVARGPDIQTQQFKVLNGILQTNKKSLFF